MRKTRAFTIWRTKNKQRNNTCQKTKETKSRGTCVASYAQSVVVCFVCHSKSVVLCVRHVSFKVLQLNSQFVVGLICQSVDLVQPEPELAAQVTEALFVVGPVSVEVDGAVESFLEDSPAPSCCGLIAEHVEGSLAVRIDWVTTTDSGSRSVVLLTMFCNWQNYSQNDKKRTFLQCISHKTMRIRSTYIKSFLPRVQLTPSPV